MYSQDDLRELSSILYYLMPQYLKSSDEVFSKLQLIANANYQEKIVQQLHSVSSTLMPSKGLYVFNFLFYLLMCFPLFL